MKLVTETERFEPRDVWNYLRGNRFSKHEHDVLDAISEFKNTSRSYEIIWNRFENGTQLRVKRSNQCFVATMAVTHGTSACLRIASLAAWSIQQPKAGPSVRLPKEPCTTATKSLAGISGWCLSPLSIFALWSCGRQNLRECFFLII